MSDYDDPYQEPAKPKQQPGQMHDALAELSTLGAMMGMRSVIEDCLAVVTAEDFWDPKHQRIFESITTLRAANLPTDFISVTDHLRTRPDVIKLGDFYITELTEIVLNSTSVVPTYVNGAYYAGIVAEQSSRRRIYEMGVRMQQIASQATPEEMLDVAHAAFEVGVEAKTSGKMRFIADILPDFLDRLASPRPDLFYRTPWTSLDDRIGGFRPANLYTIGARPAVGKSVMALQIAQKLAEYGNVAYCSLEMDEDEVLARLMADKLSIIQGKLKDAKLEPYDWDVIGAGRQALNATRIVIDDRGSVSPHDIRHFAQRVSRQPGKLTGVVVDYGQLISGDAGGNAQNRQEHVSALWRSLKLLSKELDCPVIVLSQLSRKVEERNPPIPMMSDLRESGSIEQDSSVILLLHKESYPSQSNPAIMRHEVIVDVAKNRHGETSEFALDFHGEFARMSEQGFGY